MKRATKSGLGAKSHQRRDALAILGAAVSWAFAPAIIHWALRESDPFLTNAVSLLAQSFLLIAFLAGTREQFYRYALNTVSQSRSLRQLLLSSRFYKLCFRYRREMDKDLDDEEFITVSSVVSPRNSQVVLSEPVTILDYVRLPVVLMAIGYFDLAMFVLASHYVETAVAAAVFEMWPVFLVYGLIRSDSTAARLQHVASEDSQENGHPPIAAEHLILSAVATVGLLFMLLSQEQLGESIVSIRAIMGVLLALLAALLTAIPIVASITWARALYYWLYAQHCVHALADKRIPEKRDRVDRRLLLWLAVLVTVVSKLIAVPLNLVWSLLVYGVHSSFDARIVIGACLLGIANAIFTALNRLGNLGSSERGINAVAYVSPVLALVILSILGIDLERIDLFVVGAALILAVNTLIQLQPDQQRDAAQFGKEARSGVRLGFTVLILALWSSGTILYLRDEWFPSEWLTWPSGQFWAVMGLSATVFALILGFRITRLTDRMRSEDDRTLSIFRDAERLYHDGVLGRDIEDLLTYYDGLNSRDRSDSYRRLADKIQWGLKRRRAPDHQEKLERLRERLLLEAALDMTADHVNRTIVEDWRYLQQKRAIPDFFDLLSDFDTIDRHGILPIYNMLTDELRVALEVGEATRNVHQLFDLQKQIDVLAHSKQQGRDVVELMALTLFATVTIGLGLFARQTVLGRSGAEAWSGFLGEAFVLLFVSTIAFLLMNLFDLRRERETALIARVPMKYEDGQYTGEVPFTLFFRNKRQYRRSIVVAVVISISMAAVFIALLYDKWQP